MTEKLEDIFEETNEKVAGYLKLWQGRANPDRGAEKLNLHFKLANDLGQRITLKVKKEGVLHPDSYLDKPTIPELFGKPEGDYWIFEVPPVIYEPYRSLFALKISTERTSPVSFDERLRFYLKDQYEIARFESKYIVSITFHQ